MALATTAMRKWPTCAGLSILIVTLHILLQWDYFELKAVSLRPIKVFKRGEYGRILTHSFFHEGLIHVGLNLMSLYGIGRGMEKKMGSRKFLVMTVWSVVLTSMLYLLVATLIARLSHDSSWYKEGVKGFSGVIFHWVTLKCYSDGGLRKLEFFDKIKIPAQYYPWASAALWHLIDPENDGGTLIHVCGIVVGTLQVKGYLSCFSLAGVPEDRESKDEMVASPPLTPKKYSFVQEKLDAALVRDARLRRFQ